MTRPTQKNDDSTKIAISRQDFLDRAQRISFEHFEATAKGYDQEFPDIPPVHVKCVKAFLTSLGPAPAILDAACGTGRFFGVLGNQAARLIGTDQAPAMLERAREKHPDVETHVVPLQSLADAADHLGSFDGLVCIDAMEWILNADWPKVLRGFFSVLKPGGYAYITVEIPGDAERDALARPPLDGAAAGEIQVKHWFNHFPSAEDVRTWLAEAGFVLVSEKNCEFYRHLLVRKRF